MASARVGKDLHAVESHEDMGTVGVENVIKYGQMKLLTSLG